jgi:iron complex transport system permease protein
MFIRMTLLFIAAMTQQPRYVSAVTSALLPHCSAYDAYAGRPCIIGYYAASAIVGAIFLLFCDSLGRIIIPPAEIRVGIMTALIVHLTSYIF